MKASPVDARFLLTAGLMASFNLACGAATGVAPPATVAASNAGGGMVLVDEGLPTCPADQEPTDGQVLDLSGTATDSDLACIAERFHLRHLFLNDSNVTDAGLAHLSGLRDLETLELNNANISDGGFPHLAAFPNLVRLRLSRNDVTDAGLAHLPSLP
jgi:hypothetical protein